MEGPRKICGRESATEGGKATEAGFNATDQNLDVAAKLDKWQGAGDERLFKIIVSPEFGDRLNLQQYARELLHRMEHDLSAQLEWVSERGYGTVSAMLLTSHVAPETSAGPIGTDDGLEVRICGDVAVTTFYRIGTVMYDKRTVGNWRVGLNLIFDTWASRSAVHFQLPLPRTKFNPED